MNESKNQNIEKSDVLSGMMVMFGEFLILNLETGIYDIYKMNELMKQVVTGNDFREFNERYGKALLHPEDQQKFFDVFSLANIQKYVEEGKRQILVEVRRKDAEGNYRWSEMLGTLLGETGEEVRKMVLTYRDIDDLRMARQEEKYANQRFSTAVNNSYDAIFECDAYSGVLREWKSPGGRLKDYVFNTSLTKQSDWAINNSIHPDYRKEFMRVFFKENLDIEFDKGRAEVSIQVPRLAADGTYHWFSCQAQLLERTETAFRIMYYLKDVDDVKKEDERKQEELQKALFMAEQANAAKTDFLSRMSHDIRTPMNAITGMAAIAKENTHNPEKIDDCLKKIDVSAKFLLSLINDILDMSKIESGKMSLVVRKINFEKLLNDLVIICQNQANDKHQDFSAEVGENVKRYYMGDSLRLNQILINLTCNAFKYTPEHGKIRLTIEAAERTEGKQWFMARISDNGIGISEEFLKRMYEPFEQENVSGGRIFEGSGLGLSIALNLIKLMGGTISVKSDIGKGTTFTVKIPLEAADEENTGDEGTQPPLRCELETIRDHNSVKEYHFHHERILLVEDNQINMEIAETLLTMQGLIVEAAVNGRDAVDKFCGSAPGTYQAILMDIRMPVMDGLEATRIIRSLDREDAHSIPIIAMTANAFVDEQEEALAMGISDYLTKPVDAEEMYAHLSQAFS